MNTNPVQPGNDLESGLQQQTSDPCEPATETLGTPVDQAVVQSGGSSASVSNGDLLDAQAEEDQAAISQRAVADITETSAVSVDAEEIEPAEVGSEGDPASILVVKPRAVPAEVQSKLSDLASSAGSSSMGDLKSELESVIRTIEDAEQAGISSADGDCEPASPVDATAQPTTTEREPVETRYTSDDVERLIGEIIADEESRLMEDQQSLAQQIAELEKWTSLIKRFVSSYEDGVIACRGLLAESSKANQSLPEQLQTSLRNRQQGLDLTGKMLDRSLEKLKEFPAEEPTIPNLPAVSRADCELAIAGRPSDPDTSYETLTKLRKATRAERYKVISEVRDSADAGRKRLLQFVERQVLPILDGLDDGIQHSEAVLQSSRQANPECSETLDAWFGTYDAMRERLRGALSSIQVQPLRVEIGQPIDYMQHEPFDIVTDPDLANESVKSVVRNGYAYEPADGEPRVLRAAQVVVVKN